MGLNYQPQLVIAGFQPSTVLRCFFGFFELRTFQTVEGQGIDNGTRATPMEKDGFPFL